VRDGKRRWLEERNRRSLGKKESLSSRPDA
jgi:hypothetical protein